MSATLYRGIKQLHLMLTPPYDTTDPTEPRVRDDLVGVKVWISTTAGFTPDPASAIDFAANSTIILSDLAVNTRYYVRYAFISKIEPSVYTISDQLTAKTYDELTTVYGELTNDPVYLAREPNSTDLDWTLATGTFRVWEYNLEVTGNGVTYAVVPNSANNGLVATIDPVSGVFSASGWTLGTRTAKITFSATYNGITVVRDWNIVDGIGQDAPQITLTVVPDIFVYKDSTAKLSTTTEVLATAEVVNLVGNPTFEVKAYTSAGIQITNPQITFTPVVGEPNQIKITNQQFHVSDEVAYVTIRAYIGDIYDQDTVLRLNNGTDQITVDVDNPVVQLQATETGQVDPDEYSESGTRITVYEGATKLTVSTSGGLPATWAPGSWSITTIQGFGIVPDDDWTVQSNSIVFGSHSTMTDDTAYIEYTVTYKTQAGFVGSRVVKQTFAKSKQGFPGISAPIVSIKGAQAFVRPADGSTAAIVPAYIDLVAATSNITNPQFQWSVDGVAQVGETESDFRVLKFFNVESKVIRVDVTGLNSQGEQITQFDEHTIYFVSSGDNAVVAFCTPEFTGISCDSQGVPESGQFPLYIDTTVLRGGTVLSNSTIPGAIVYQLQSLDGILPGDISINQTTGQITLSDIQNTYSSFVVEFTVGTTVINKSVRLNKILEGNSASVVVLTATNQVFVKTKNTGTVVPSNTTITATAINIPNPVYRWLIDGVAQPQFDDDASVQISSFEGLPKLVRCNVTSSTVPSISTFDLLTLYSVKEGDDALVFGITNENQTLTCDNAGVPVPGQFPITSQLVTLLGAAIVNPPAVQYSIVSQTGTDPTKVSISGTTLSIASGGITADSAEIVVKAVVGTTELTKSLTISKSKEGKTGARTARVGLYAKNTSGTNPPAAFSGTFTYTFSTNTLTGGTLNGWSTSAPSLTNGEYLWARYAVATSSTDTDTIEATEFSAAIVESIAGTNGTNGTNGLNGADAQTVDINGFTGFTVSTGGAFTPANTTLSALLSNINNPVYNWSISGGTLSSTTSASVTVTPSSGATSITVTLSVTGSNLAVAKTNTITMPIAQQGAPGQVGANGTMSAFPSIYRWTGSSTAPSTAGLASSTYTWSNGSYSAPADWSTTPPSNTTPGQYLWEVTIPLVVSATTQTSSLNWSTQTARAISYTGTPGATGATGSAGSATFLVTRSANDSSAPTNAETIAAIGRAPVAGDIATVNYNNGNASINYKYVTSWVQQTAYITGSLIVQNSISGDRIIANSLAVDKITSGATAAVNGGVFALGDTTSVSGFPGVIAAKQTGSNWGLLGIQENTSSVTAGVVGATISTSGFSIVGANFTSTTYNSIRTLGAFGGPGIACLGRYLRNIGTSNNNSDTPLNQGNIGMSDCTGRFIWYGTSGSSPVVETLLSTATHAIDVTVGLSRLQNTQINSLGVGTTATGNAGEVRATGNIISYFSDDRLKIRHENIPDALQKVKSLDGFYYTPNQTAVNLGYKANLEVGVSAQAVQKILPEIVDAAPISDKYLTVKYDKLVPLLIEAIKELSQEVDVLRRRLDDDTHRTNSSE